LQHGTTIEVNLNKGKLREIRLGDGAKSVEKQNKEGARTHRRKTMRGKTVHEKHLKHKHVAKHAKKCCSPFDLLWSGVFLFLFRGEKADVCELKEE
jgi:hypothetical protein